MATNNFLSWFSGNAKNREMGETHSSWTRAERQWKDSPLASADMEELATEIVRNALEKADRKPAAPVIAALCEATVTLLSAEAIGEIDPLWPVIKSNIEAAVAFRAMLKRRARWATEYARVRKAYAARLSGAYLELVQSLPEACFAEWDDAKDTFGVPLIDLIDNPAQVIERLFKVPYSDTALSLDLFAELRTYFRDNIYFASGISLDKAGDREPDLIIPTEQRGKSARELSDLYLAGTPFANLLELSVPFTIPLDARFEHCHVIAGTGHGKTQLLQKMIHTDLVASQYDRRSVVVLDSQGDLIRKLSNLELFSPYVGGGLGERLMLIDPSDVEHPIAMNLFDPHLERLKDYDAVGRERVLNGVVELYETFFDALLGAELTQRQDVVFRYIARLMLTIPGATIHTLMELMENGRTFTPYMEKLEGSAKRFFEQEFFSPSFAATKGQVSKRLWGVLATPSFDRMFSQKENRLDLFEALNSGTIILVNTAKDLLKDEGSRLFGRFFMAMLVQATLERSTLKESERNPTFVYVDEAHEYFDDRVETVLNQARKFKVSLTLAHQNLEQLSPRLRATLLTNTSTKCAGGVSAKDARLLADELHTTVEYIESMRRRGPQTEFATWVKHFTPHAVRLTVPLGFLERQHTLEDEDFEALLARNRERYCGTAELPTAETETLVRDARAEPDPQRASTPPSPVPSIAFPLPGESVHRQTAPRDLGKGGPKHKYLQALIKELAEQQGLKATVEAPLSGGGLVDMLLEREGVVAAIEISVSTPIEHEQDNLKRCLRAGYPKVAIVLAKPRATQARMATALLAGITEDERHKVSIIAPEGIPDFVASLVARAKPTEKVVKGYRVKVSHTNASPEEIAERRSAIAKVIARSIDKR